MNMINNLAADFFCNDEILYFSTEFISVKYLLTC